MSEALRLYAVVSLFFGASLFSLNGWASFVASAAISHEANELAAIFLLQAIACKIMSLPAGQGER